MASKANTQSEKRAGTLMRREQADNLIRRILHGSSNVGRDKGQWPPYAVVSWDDRARFQQYIFDCIEEQVAP